MDLPEADEKLKQQEKWEERAWELIERGERWYRISFLCWLD